MPVSHYFNNFAGNATSEQRLLEDVIVESIKIMGHDVYYIPRDSYNGIDEIWGESINAKFTRAYTIEAYLANVEGYEGDGDFFSKFGLDIRDTTNVVISYKSFNRYVPSQIVPRPREGDLVYIPVMKKLFEIKFVEEELLFFSIGRRNPYIYELRCDLFRYSGEALDTGVEVIDVVEKDNSYAISLDVINGNGHVFRTEETVYQGANVEFALAKATVKEFNPETKELELYNIVGTFSVNTAIRGVTSGAIYTVTTGDTLGDYTYYDLKDNKPLQDDANNIIVVTENNPFGAP
jgi:hypothetical protein